MTRCARLSRGSSIRPTGQQDPLRREVVRLLASQRVLPLVVARHRHKTALLLEWLPEEAMTATRGLTSRRHGEAEHPGGLEIDDELELARLHDRQVRRLGALEDAASIGADLTKRFRNVRSVAHQSTGFGKVTIRICCGDSVVRRHVGQLDTPVVETGKRRFAPDCVVADAVDIEPVF
jgi:hypothetical protein